MGTRGRMLNVSGEEGRGQIGVVELSDRRKKYASLVFNLVHPFHS